MPLKQEKEILKQIQKLERTKRQIVDFHAYNKMVQEKKVRIVSCSNHYAGAILRC
jgi:hypothetical protein